MQAGHLSGTGPANDWFHLQDYEFKIVEKINH
jgi:hypothetical protein